MPICSITDRFQTDMLFSDMFQTDTFCTGYVTDHYVMSVHRLILCWWSCFFYYFFFKGLVAKCHSFCIYFLYTVETFIHHSFIHKHSLRPISICPVVAFNSAFVSVHDIAVILNVACCWRYCCFLKVWWHTATLFYLFHINE